MKNLVKVFSFLIVIGSGVLTLIKMNKTNKKMIAKETTSFQIKQTLSSLTATLEKAEAAQAETNQQSPHIKGNKNARGELIYHLPGGAFYERTNPVEWFHTEKDAQEKGYRKSAR